MVLSKVYDEFMFIRRSLDQSQNTSTSSHQKWGFCYHYLEHILKIYKMSKAGWMNRQVCPLLWCASWHSRATIFSLQWLINTFRKLMSVLSQLHFHHLADGILMKATDSVLLLSYISGCCAVESKWHPPILCNFTSPSQVCLTIPNYVIPEELFGHDTTTLWTAHLVIINWADKCTRRFLKVFS